MDDQARRFRNAKLVGTASTTFIVVIVMALFVVFEERLEFGSDTVLIPLGVALGTFTVIQFFWIKTMKKRETRKRGLWMGFAAGPLALLTSTYFSTWLVMLHAGLTSFDVWQQNDSMLLSVLLIIFLAPLLVFAFGFFLGGFLTLPAGALFGWFFSRDTPDERVEVFD